MMTARYLLLIWVMGKQSLSFCVEGCPFLEPRRSRLSWRGPGQPRVAVGNPARGRGLRHNDLQDDFHPKPFCDYMVIFCLQNCEENGRNKIKPLFIFRGKMLKAWCSLRSCNYHCPVFLVCTLMY